MNTQLYAPGYKAKPYWWDHTPRPALNEVPLPEKVDVVVIGSGYTGLCASLETTRGGRHTLVIDAQDAGWGCSTRNGGQVATGLSVGYERLVRKHGKALGYAIAREGHNALAWICDFIEAESISCEFRRSGRFCGAHSLRAYEALARMYGRPPPQGLETDCHMVTQADLRSEIDSDFYHGGVVHPRHAALNPARFHQGLLTRAIDDGVSVIANCAASGIDKSGSGFVVNTTKGSIVTHDVVVATNGYTGHATPWLRNRIVPLGSYILATEPLSKDVIDRLLPHDRMMTDTRKMVVYYRTCPERRRILFGGRVSVREEDAHSLAPALHRQMVQIFPELSATRISHMWMGFVGFSFDRLPHLGRQDGIYYSMGYCGSGIALSGYMGMRIGQQVLGLAEGDSPLNRVRYQGRPYYWGKPWFMVPALHYYKWRDALT